MALDWQVFERLNSKIKRAEQHINDIQSLWLKFREDAYPVVSKDNPYTGQRIYSLRDAAPIPEEIPWLLGDAAHNLISALDHVAYHLVSVFTNGSGPFTNVYFPVAKTSRHFRKKLLRTADHETAPGRIIKRLGQGAIKAIEDIEPYEGGRGQILAYIHGLDIIDKHHVLLTVGSMNRLHTMPPDEIASYKKSFGIGDHDFTPLHASRVFLTESAWKFPLKTGDELLRVPLAQVDENMYFPFEVAFGEPEIIKGKPIVETLHQAAKVIRDIIREFERTGLLG